MKQESEVVVIKSCRKEDIDKGYVGYKGKTFRITLDKVLKPYDVITICKAFGEYLIVEKVDGYEHTMSILERDSDKKYPAEFLKNTKNFVSTTLYVKEVVEKLKIENKLNNNEQQYTPQE